MKSLSLILIATVTAATCMSQSTTRPEDTEVWSPVPAVVTPGKTNSAPPSDAIILFDGKDLDQWVLADHPDKKADWIIHDGIVTVNKKSGNIQTRKTFTDYQLHLEWKIPEDIDGSGQDRGNSGLFLASTGTGDAGYEIQILDSYKNKTYVNGQAGSVYKQYPPLVNANRFPGQWQTYDVIWTAPRFNEDGSLKSPAYVTVFFNGILVQNHAGLKGVTLNEGKPYYKAHGPEPVKLQAHGDTSKPISFRNIWLRRLD